LRPATTDKELTDTDTRQPITDAGAMAGTLQYMSPEQVEGREADARSDIFAFGAVVYEMLTSRRAFEGRSQASRCPSRSGEIARIVLQVGVHGQDVPAGRLVDAAQQCRRLPQISPEGEHSDVLVGLREGSQVVETAVGRPVVDEHHFVGLTQRRDRLCDGGEKLRETLGLVVDGNDDREGRGRPMPVGVRHHRIVPGQRLGPPLVAVDEDRQHVSGASASG